MTSDSDPHPTLPLVGGEPDGAVSTAPPPHPFDGGWFVNVGGETYGPYSGHDIRSYVEEGRINAYSTIAPAGSEEWRRICDDPVLGVLFDRGKHAYDESRSNAVRVSADDGATVVQVTNHITQPNTAALLEGPAAPKSAGVALLLSLLICSVGQIYNGQVGKGIGMFFLALVLWFVLLGWVVWIWSIIDAYQTAKAMNLRYMRVLAGG
jgi:TM2 domain-containing membrane protein YozV